MSDEDFIRGVFALLGAGVCVFFIAIVWFMIDDIIHGAQDD